MMRPPRSPRRPTAQLLALLCVVVLLSACGAGDDPGSPSGGNGDAGEATAADLVGELGGDAQLEGGCAWLSRIGDGFPDDIDDDRVEPMWPEGYQVSFEPLRLVGPSGEVVAEEGDVVEVNGRPADDVLTVCQVGQPFQVTEVLGSR